MTIQTLGKEIWKLIANSKKIIFSTVFVVLLLFGMVQFFNLSNRGSMDTLPNEENTAQFDIYIEDDTQGIYINSFLIEELIKDTSVVSQIESETGVDIQAVLDEFAEENTVTYTEDDPINVERQRSSQIMFVTFNIGTQEENLAVAEAYYQWFEAAQEENTFFANKDLYFINSPFSVNTPEENGEVSDSTGVSIKELVAQGILVLFVGIIAGVVIAFIVALLSPIIKYTFTYGWSIEDQFIKYSKKTDEKEIANSILRSANDNTIVLAESNNVLDTNLTFLKKNSIKQYNRLNEVPFDKKIEEIIFIISKGETSKKWYSEQRRELKFMDATSIKIVEL